MAQWFECKVRYDKLMENGMQKKVNEPYMVDALSFTEAEARIIEEVTDFKGALDNFMEGMKGTMADFEIASIAETTIMDVYKAKLSSTSPAEA